jgi:hypothetical protein
VKSGTGRERTPLFKTISKQFGELIQMQQQLTRIVLNGIRFFLTKKFKKS